MLKEHKMDFKVFVFLLLNSVQCQAFLLDTVTQISPTKDPALTDKHFDILMDLLMEQRRSQRKQDQVIAQLSQALLTLQQEVSKNQFQNGSVNNRLLECENKTDKLKRELETVKGTFEIMKNEYMMVVQNLTNVDTKANQIDKEIVMLKNLKSVTELRNISDIFNKTDRNELEIQMTNHRMNKVINDANARKQDVIALYNKADLTENNLDKHLKELANRVILVAGATRGTYADQQTILFHDIIISNGVRDVDSFKSTGAFTCERGGMYQIAAYIASNANHCSFTVRKNKAYIGDAFASLGDFFETMTFISVVELKVNDTIEIYSGRTGQLVYGNRESGISIVQIR